MEIKKVEEKSMQIKRASEQSIKVKNQSIKSVAVTGARIAADQVDGGEEVQNATFTAYVMEKPMAEASKQGARFARESVRAAYDRRIKRKEKQIAKRGKGSGETDGANSGENSGAGQNGNQDNENDSRSDEQKKDSSKDKNKRDGERRDRERRDSRSEERKSSGHKERFAGRKKSSGRGESDEVKDKKRKRGIRGLIRQIQMAAFLKQNEDGENEAKKSRWQMLLIQKIAIPVLGFLTLGMMLMAIVALPVMLVIALIYNSPFGIFFPPLESGDTVQSVTSAYVAEFNREVNDLVTNHAGYDAGRIVYVDYEGTNASPTNYYDILTVYMVKHGVGDSATMMNDTTMGWIKTVVDDMCDYTTSSGMETSVDADGNEVSQSVLYVNVKLKDYQDMISVYGFNEDKVKLLESMMSPESLAMLGYSSDSSSGASSISRAEIDSILSGISDEKQRKVCSYALSRVGFAYSQAYRDSGNYYDCSSLVYYAWKYVGVDIGYGGATTAAAEAQGLESAGKTVEYEIYDSGNGVVCNGLQPGDLIFFSYCHNGRYKNISHVAIYVGSGKVVEAKSESAGVVYGDVPNLPSIVLVGRPQ